MYYYPMYQFATQSETPLIPAAASDGPVQSSLIPLAIQYRPDSLTEFRQVYLTGKMHRGFLRAYDTGDSGILISTDAGCRMLVGKDGKSVTLDFDKSDQTESSVSYACATNLGASIASLLHGFLPLHSASAELCGSLIAILAPSGTGKSTLLWALMDSGARFASDDVLPVAVDGKSVTAFPSMSLPGKLSAVAMEARGLDCANYMAVFPGGEEYWIPIEAGRRVHEPQPLTALFVLKPYAAPQAPGRLVTRRVVGAPALLMLLDNIQGLWAAAGPLDTKAFISQLASLASLVPVHAIEYHRYPGVLPGLVDAIQEATRASAGGKTPRAGGSDSVAGAMKRWRPFARGGTT